MLEKYLIPCVFYFFAILEFILGCYMTFIIGVQYAEPFGIYNFFECLLLFCFVLYITFSLVDKGCYLHKIIIGKIGNSFNCRNEKNSFALSSYAFENNDLKAIYDFLSAEEKYGHKNSVTTYEVIYYILSILIFILGIFIAFFISISLSVYVGFSFELFTIVLIPTIYASLISVSKAISKTYMRKYLKLHQLQVLCNILHDIEASKSNGI